MRGGTDPPPEGGLGPLERDRHGGLDFLGIGPERLRWGKGETRVFEISLIEDVEGISGLAPEWGMLVEDSITDEVYGAPWIFSRPEWHLSWLEAYGSACRPRVVAARAGGRLVGVLPMAVTRGRYVDFFSTYLEPMTGYFADYQAPVLAKGRKDALGPMLDAAFQGIEGQVLVWRNLPLTHPVARNVREHFAARGWPVVAEESVCPYLRLSGSYSEIEKLWKGKLRQDVRRRRRKLDGSLALEVIERAEDVPAWLEDLFAAHRRKWLSESQPSEFASQTHQDYYRAMARKLFGKGLHLSSLLLDGRRVSYHCGFLSGGWFYFYKTAYDKEFASVSPTKLHVSLLMELGCASGWQGFDFLQGDEPYKFDWTSQRIPCVTLVAGIGKGGLKYFWHSRWRNQAKSALGPTVKAIRRAVQKEVAP